MLRRITMTLLLCISASCGQAPAPQTVVVTKTAPVATSNPKPAFECYQVPACANSCGLTSGVSNQACLIQPVSSN